jgi:hypothetical protein
MKIDQIIKIITDHGYPIFFSISICYIVYYIWKWITIDIKPKLINILDHIEEINQKIKQVDHEIEKLNQKIYLLKSLRNFTNKN